MIKKLRSSGLFSAVFVLIVSTALALQPSAAPSRREWIKHTAAAIGGLSLVASSPQTAHASPSFVSGLQGPIQDAIAPGHWLGQFVGLNSRTESWEFPNRDPGDVSKALVQVLEELTDDRKAKLVMPEFEIRTADAARVHVLTWTKLEWLDTLDVKFSPSGTGCTARASFYATGFFPTSIPGAPLANVAMAWLPFASPGPRGEMLQEFRLRALKGLITKQLQTNQVVQS